jgi:hypothetical protein
MGVKNAMRAMAAGKHNNLASMNLGDIRVIKVSKTYADFSAAALTNNIKLFELPGGCAIIASKLKHRQIFTGGAVASTTISVGPAGGTATKYQAARDVFAAVSANGAFISASSGQEGEHGTTPVGVNAFMTTTTANIDALTSGIVDFYFTVVKMG